MIEIERKFLLKGIPDRNPDEIIKINQWYLKNEEGVWERVRSWDSNLNGKKWIQTIKTRISDMSNIEDEKEVTEEEFFAFKRKCHSKKSQGRFINKERKIYIEGDLKWEVDIFKSGCQLVIAEIEIPTEDYELSIPDFIDKKSLMEVTGLKQFSNRSLANKVKTK
jgi:CYTH domain-containing protein